MADEGEGILLTVRANRPDTCLICVFTRSPICVFIPMPEHSRVGHARVVPNTPLLKLLVVDDHEAFRRTMRQVLDSSTTQITEASSGEEGVRLFADVRPDWVVMDLRMPGMGGIKATEAIRQIDPKARVIAVSQFIETEYIDQARQAGAVEFVDKQDLSLLARIIRGQSSET